ncbi:MAG: metallophosphoesterase [Phycisphaerales bacterium]|nr:MAG: metallophosphoesterase [Phycisphaerales bacterium]
MLLREKVSLIAFMLALLILYGAEVLLLLDAIVTIVRHRSPRRILLCKPAIVLHVLAAAGLLCIGYGRFVEPTWIEVNVITVPTAKLQNTTFRLVQISDLHCDREIRNEEAIVRIINELKPDMVVATGDYLNDATALPRLKATLSRLEAPLGAFAVTGNFEVNSWSDLDLFSETGFHLLTQETVSVTKGSESITISGLGFDHADAWQELLANLPDDRFNVLLYHKSDLVEDVSGSGVDLYLCGHTHGGQVALPFYGALTTLSKFGKKYESGRYQVGDTTLYVNRGLGLEPRPAPQVRFCARPEIAVFKIVPASQMAAPEQHRE